MAKKRAPPKQIVVEAAPETKPERPAGRGGAGRGRGRGDGRPRQPRPVCKF